MNETLILVPGPSPDAPVLWALLSDGKITLSDRAPNIAALSAIAERASLARQVICVLPGEDVAMRHLPAPPRAHNQFRAAAGFLLEDELAESLDNIHLAVMRHESGSGLSLAVKKPIIDMWLAALAEVGIAPDIMTPDFAMLAMAEGRAVFLDLPDRVIGVAGFSGFAVERQLADEITAAIVANDKITEIIIYGGRTLDVSEREGVSVDWPGPLDDSGLIAIFAEGGAAAPNLLQGAYRKRRDWRASAGPWRRVGLVAAASIAAVLLVTVAGIVRDLRTADRLRDDTIELHQAAFPDAAGADPRTYARQVLSSGGARPAFLMISNAVADSIGDDPSVQVDRIRYNGARGDYSINLRFSDIAEFEALKRALEGRGLRTAENGSVRRAGNVYLGELRVNPS